MRAELVLVACLAASTVLPVCAQSLSAPNVVVISPLLVTSGQPPATTLATLRQLGFEAVIYLAPATVPNAMREEAALLANQNIEFIHVPIPFGAPEERHVDEVSAALERLKAKKVLVHCEVNMRASSMVFLHRVVQGKEDPAQAYEAVAAVWSPRGVWRRLIETRLRKHGIPFEIY